MLWGEYKRLETNKPPVILEGQAIMCLITEGGTDIYCAKVYMNHFTGRKLGELKKEVAEKEETRYLFMKYRMFLIMDTLFFLGLVFVGREDPTGRRC